MPEGEWYAVIGFDHGRRRMGMHEMAGALAHAPDQTIGVV